MPKKSARYPTMFARCLVTRLNVLHHGLNNFRLRVVVHVVKLAAKNVSQKFRRNIHQWVPPLNCPVAVGSRPDPWRSRSTAKGEVIYQQRSRASPTETASPSYACSRSERASPAYVACCCPQPPPFSASAQKAMQNKNFVLLFRRSLVETILAMLEAFHHGNFERSPWSVSALVGPVTAYNGRGGFFLGGA